VVERTDQGQEMEITPLLTSVENGGWPGRFVEKIFWGFVVTGRIGGRVKKTSTYICTESGVLGTCFWKNIFWGRTEENLTTDLTLMALIRTLPQGVIKMTVVGNQN
jgi:hypothetical protein